MAGHDGGPGTQCRAGEHPVNEAIWPLGENHMEERRKTYLGIDIGGTEVKMGIMTAEGEILEDRSASVSFDGYRTPIIKTVRGEAAAFLREFSAAHPDLPGVCAVGVSATGQIDTENGIVTGTAGHLRGWVGTRIKEELEEELHCPVRAANDANCALLGERWLGAARGEENVILLTIGTGVGGGILTDGHLLNGARGIAGEIGHIVIKEDGELCSCGNRGCLERYGSAAALTRMVQKGIEEGAISGFAGEVNGRNVFEHLQNGRGGEELGHTVRQWIRYIADGIVSLVHIFNPRMILIGGGVSAQEEWFIRPLREEVFLRVLPSYRENLLLQAAVLGNRAGFVGAVYLCREKEQ